MKNTFLEYFKNKIVLKIKGKNIDRFIRRLVSNQIELLKIEEKKYNEIYITIYEKDYEKILELKTIYEVQTIDTFGMIKIRKQFHMYKLWIFMITLSIFFIYFLTNIIFEIEIIHTDKEIRNLIKKELENYGIKEKTFKKNYQKIQEIKKKILENNKDTLEWIEIENIGVKYIVRVEEREQNPKEEAKEERHIVAKKDGILRKIDVIDGEVKKEISNYVQKGDIIVSGSISLNEKVMKNVSAKGKIYAEVWYKIHVSYPLDYYEKKYLKHKKNVYTVKILNKRIELFNFSPMKEKEIKSKTLLAHSFLPISLVKEKQQEIEIIDEHYNKKEALLKAREEATKKMKDQLSEDEYIISQKDLKINVKDSKIELEEFFSVLEDITAYKKIEGDEHVPGDDP